MSTDMRVSLLNTPREVTWEVSYYGMCLSYTNPSFINILAEYDLLKDSTEELMLTPDEKTELAFADWANLKRNHWESENTIPYMLWVMIQMQSGRLIDDRSIACIMELYDLFMLYFDPHPQFVRGEFHDFLCRAKGRAVFFFS